jgi:hypothetical protein
MHVQFVLMLPSVDRWRLDIIPVAPLPPKVPAENHAAPSSHTTPLDVTPLDSANAVPRSLRRRGDDRRCRRRSSARNVPPGRPGRGPCLTRTQVRRPIRPTSGLKQSGGAEHEDLAKRLQQYSITLPWLDRTVEPVLLRSVSGNHR